MLQEEAILQAWPPHLSIILLVGVVSLLCAVLLLVCCADSSSSSDTPTAPRIVVDEAGNTEKTAMRTPPTLQPRQTDRLSGDSPAATPTSGYLNVQIPVSAGAGSDSDKPFHSYLNAHAANTRFEPVKFNINKCIGPVKKKITQHIVDEKHLQLMDVIGKGAFGLVYKGTYKDVLQADPKQVAVKTVHGDECSPADMKSFLEEVVRMVGFNHENVQSTIGVCFKGSQPYAIMPYMDYGDLRAFIVSPERELTIRRLLEFGLQIAKGMEYLSCRKFVHRDLAARNCMVNSHYVIKVADFGLSRDIFTSDYYRMKNDNTTPLPVRWMAPESIARLVFTTKTDVWSFGIVMWELTTRGLTPYPTRPSLSVVQFVKDGGKPEKLPGCPSRVFDIMSGCWRREPERRPSFHTLVSQMHTVLGGGGG